MSIIQAWVKNNNFRIKIEVEFNDERRNLWGEYVKMHDQKFLFEPTNQPFTSKVARFGVDMIESTVSILFRPEDKYYSEEFVIIDTTLFDQDGEEIENSPTESYFMPTGSPVTLERDRNSSTESSELMEKTYINESESDRIEKYFVDESEYEEYKILDNFETMEYNADYIENYDEKIVFDNKSSYRT